MNCAGKDVQVGQWLNVWWPKEEARVSGQVSQFNTHSLQHEVDYLDGDQAHHTLDKEHALQKSSSKSKINALQKLKSCPVLRGTRPVGSKSHKSRSVRIATGQIQISRVITPLAHTRVSVRRNWVFWVLCEPIFHRLQ